MNFLSESVLPGQFVVHAFFFEFFIVLLGLVGIFLALFFQFLMRFGKVLMLKFELIVVYLQFTFIPRQIGDLLFEFCDLPLQVQNVLL